jgi:capsid assembly protease
MPMKHERILNALCAHPWAIHPAKLEEIFGVVEARARGVTLTPAEAKQFAKREKKYSGIKGQVMVLGLYGTISQRIGLLEGSGGTSADEFGKKLDQSINDEAVGAILIDGDTPGGSVFGVPELGEKIFNARGRGKPIVGIANSEAYSAGFWLLSACDEVVMTPGGQVGSVGVIAAHYDYSKQNEALGVRVTYVTAGRYKAEANEDEPLDDEARAELQSHVDRYYGMFVDALARNRGVSTKQVKSDFGQGRIFGAADAVKRGMADRIAPFDQVVRELNAGRTPKGPRTPGDGGPRGQHTRSVELMRKRLALKSAVGTTAADRQRKIAEQREALRRRMAN